MKLLGSLSAHIPGDRRYTDRLVVEIDDDARTVRVRVFSTGAVGGMDSQLGATEPRTAFDETTTVNIRAGRHVLALIKKAINRTLGGRPGTGDEFLFKRYGKPTKNFVWVDGVGRGLSIALVTEALRTATYAAANRRAS